MYAKLFKSLYQGTLRGNSHGLLVFTNLLANADMTGVVDMHPRAIAEEVGLTQDEVRAALLELEAEDIESRSPEEGGRRLLRLDDHRAWGWKIVNYLKYRSIRNEEDRREQNRLAQERFRNKRASASGKQSKPRKPMSAHTEAEAEALNTEPTALVDTAAPNRPPACPTEQIVALYHEKLPMLPMVAVLSPGRKKAIAARWKEVVAVDKMDRAAGLEWFGWFFSQAANSAFLTGRAPPGKDRHVFRADLDWLLTPKYFPRVAEGRYK